MATAKVSNLYMAKMAAEERPCFVCNKFTPVVLTTADDPSQDWFYVCRTHLGDRNFCTKMGGASPSPPKSPKKTYTDRPPESDSVTELVASIGSAWNAWRKKGDEKKDDGGAEEEKEETTEKKKDVVEAERKHSPAPSPPKPIRFILHRDYFYLRQREIIKRVQKKEASEKLRTLQFPEVPKDLPKK